MLYYLCDNLLAGEHYAYENAMFRGVCAALFCFVAVLLAGRPTIRQLLRWKIGDRPDFDHATLNAIRDTGKNVPTMGGILIIGVVIMGILLFADVLANFYVQMALVCLVWLALLGAVDDWLKLTKDVSRDRTRDGLRSWEKLLFQFGLGILLGYFIFSYGRTNYAVFEPAAEVGQVEIETYRLLALPFYKPGLMLTVPLFMLVTVLVTTFTSNAVNLTDGMDGLASGCVLACTAVFMIICDIVGDADVARKLLFPYIRLTGELTVVCGSILGATAGFLWYNCHPAQVFMGDTGSLPLGGVIGYIAIVTRQEVMLLIVGGVFVIEAVSVILQVGSFKLRGKRIFRCAPIHHHFELKGWTETQTVVRFWLLAAVFAAVGLATIKLR